MKCSCKSKKVRGSHLLISHEPNEILYVSSLPTLLIVPTVTILTYVSYNNSSIYELLLSGSVDYC